MENISIIKTRFKEERENYPGKSFDIEKIILNFFINDLEIESSLFNAIHHIIFECLIKVNLLKIVINSGVHDFGCTSNRENIVYKERAVTYLGEFEKNRKY